GLAIQKDPWGLKNYQWGNDATTGSRATTANSGRFYLDVSTPTSNIAKRLAALLPYAEFCDDDGTCTADSSDSKSDIRAYVNIPGQAVNNDIVVKDFGHASLHQDDSVSPSVVCVEKSISVACNPGETGDIYVGLNKEYYHWGIGTETIGAWVKYAANTHFSLSYDQKYYQDDGDYPYCIDNDDGSFDCSFKLCTQRGSDTGASTFVDAKATYITMCRKN
ncbi:MAG: hypothetical protein KAT71_07055, partial [Gammaproteobacteria bacterium]|nr:hypothetical protein [Gammaproteobacteria bacterium]